LQTWLFTGLRHRKIALLKAVIPYQQGFFYFIYIVTTIPQIRIKSWQFFFVGIV